jgi:hypothetical protein
VTDFTETVVTSEINAADNLVKFQGDFTFDSSVVTFQDPPVSSDGLTASNWTVTGNVLGAGTIKTLHVSASSNDSTPLSGSGTLFTLNMTRVSSTPGAVSPLVWRPDPDSFIFIDVDLNIHGPGSTPPGSISIEAITISGTVSYCSNPSLNPVPNVTLTLTGDTTASTLSNGSGTYQFLSLTPGGSYTVTPTKGDLALGSGGIDTIDVVATQRHYLTIGTPLSGCRLAAADVNGDTAVNTVDLIAIQRFYLNQPFGVANVGKYQFTPASRTYPAVGSNQPAQNYDVLIFGDVAPSFADRPGGPSQDAAGDDTLSYTEVPATVAAVALPEVAVAQVRSNFIAAVKTTAIDAKNKLVGFQGNFTFDERVVTFQSEPVQKAGITGGNWNVSGNVLPGTGPIRTLRISAYSNDFTPLSGSGTLFELRMTGVRQASQGTPLLWAAPPNQFIFIDADLKTQQPGNAAPGRVAPSGKRK